jgi:group I intron endonuclease
MPDPTLISLRTRTGVYFIRNTVNGQLYIGSAARSFGGRWAEHQSRMNNGIHANRHLMSAWLLNGADAFEFGILEDCSPEDCILCEQKWLDFFQPEYNKCKVAGSRRGIKASDETKRKISLAQKGRKYPFRKLRGPPSEETLRKKSVALKGRPLTEETKAKLSAAAKGRKMSAETREKMSISRRAFFARSKTSIAT